jgi:hypothetical protein
LDTLGRTITNTLVSDPDATTSVNTAYDPNGRAYTVSNPHRSTSSPTDGLETVGYDGLDRQLTDTHADNMVAKSYYGDQVTANSVGGLASQVGSTSTYGYGYPVLSIDEAGNPKQSWIDGFGRIIETDEPVPVTAPTSASGSATVNAYSARASSRNTYPDRGASRMGWCRSAVYYRLWLAECPMGSVPLLREKMAKRLLLADDRRDVAHCCMD